MISITLTVLPIFALVFAGWAVRKLGILGPNSTTELNRFVVYLALPALLFDIVAHAQGADIRQPGFAAAFGLSCLITFAITVGVSAYCRRAWAEAAIDGLNAAYPNTGFMGFPLVLRSSVKARCHWRSSPPSPRSVSSSGSRSSSSKCPGNAIDIWGGC